MRVDGEWLRFSDNEVRPIVRAWVTAPNGVTVQTVLLVDTGADRTVLTREVTEALRLPLISPAIPVVGVGGLAATFEVKIVIGFRLDDGRLASFRGNVIALSDPTALDVSVLGRDILQQFALIVDQPGDVVCLVNQRHGYHIVTA